MQINALLYFQIIDPFKAVYEINNLPNAIEKLTQTTLRNIIGEMELDQTLTSRDTINTKLRAVLDDATNKWGIKVTVLSFRILLLQQVFLRQWRSRCRLNVTNEQLFLPVKDRSSQRFSSLKVRNKQLSTELKLTNSSRF